MSVSLIPHPFLEGAKPGPAEEDESGPVPARSSRRGGDAGERPHSHPPREPGEGPRAGPAPCASPCAPLPSAPTVSSHRRPRPAPRVRPLPAPHPVPRPAPVPRPPPPVRRPPPPVRPAPPPARPAPSPCTSTPHSPPPVRPAPALPLASLYAPPPAPQRRSGPAPRARRPQPAGSVAEQASRRWQVRDVRRTETGAGTHGARLADRRWESAARGRRGSGPPGQEQAAAQAGGGQAAGLRVTFALRRRCFRSLLLPALRAAAPLPF